jgi:hypothetical protein
MCVTRAVGRLVAIAGVVALVGCSAAPRQRPVKMGDVQEGPNTLESVRRQLEGNWMLTEFDVLSGPSAGKQPVVGQLTYDAYGNLSLLARIDRPGQTPEVIEYSGRAVVDVRAQTLKLDNIKYKHRPTAATLRAAALDEPRQYAFVDQSLTLSAIGADGKPTARVVYKRRVN